MCAPCGITRSKNTYGNHRQQRKQTASRIPQKCGDSEEAVFVLTKGDPEPTEIGPGIDSERYILHKINEKALKPLRFQDFYLPCHATVDTVRCFQ